MTAPTTRTDEADRAANDRVRRELLEASDAAIEDAVSHADVMVLRGLIHQLTGDPEIAATRIADQAAGAFMGGVQLSKEDDALVRRKAVEFLASYRDSGAGALDIGPAERLPTSMSLTMGKEFEPEALDLWLEELAVDPWARGLQWSQEPPPSRDDFSVTIIGAGMGGLNAAIQLKRLGIPFSVIEKNEDVGGTWYENRYPGARVDTPSRLYTHLFGVDYSYPYSFCPWTENQKYFDWVAERFDLRADITFKTEVHALVWDEAASEWEISVEGPGGARTLRSNAVITAVGFLNRPDLPDIPGVERFRGPSWHTARWPSDFDPTGKRVAVIGTGCTGYQMVPELALEAGHADGLPAHAPMALPRHPDYRSPFPPQVPWLDRNLPYHTNFMRLRIASRLHRRASAPSPRVDPDFRDEHAVSPINKARPRSTASRSCESQARRPRPRGEDDTRASRSCRRGPSWSTPSYSILDAIQRDDVTLVVDAISRDHRETE